MRFIEYIIYESRPFAYAGLGAYSFTYHDMSRILALSGIVLILCSIAVLNMRFKYRLQRKL